MPHTADRTEPIDDRAFRDLSSWLYRQAGIHLSDKKKALVAGRLGSRLRHHRLTHFSDYYSLLHDGHYPDEAQVAVDLLTTNETHFFREPRHFTFLSDQIVPRHAAGRSLRVWSAACSSGEEPYSIAMTLASALGDAPWEVLASDLSTRVLERARNARYAIERVKNIPRVQLESHCLKGVGQFEGVVMVAPHITSRVRFAQINLNEPLPAIGEFDVIFLRNVMIYFDAATKQRVVGRVTERLRRGGHLMIGHAESLTGARSEMVAVAPSVYLKP